MFFWVFLGIGCSSTDTLFILLLIVYVIVKVLNLNMNQNVDIIGAPTGTHASIVIFDPIGSCQISDIKGNLINISGTIASLIPIKHTNEMKYESSQLVSQTQSQSPHDAKGTVNNSFNICLIGAGSHDFDCDINNIFKYWCDKNFNGDCERIVHYESDGMLVFNFLFLHIHSTCILLNMNLFWFFVFFDIESAIEKRKRNIESKISRNNYFVNLF